QSRERWPLRYPSRSGVRSCGSAPSLAATSSCMSASAITLTAERRKSTSPPVAAFPSWSSNAILSAAIVSVLPADVRHLLEDHAVALAVKGLDLHHSPGHYWIARRVARRMSRSWPRGVVIWPSTVTTFVAGHAGADDSLRVMIVRTPPA